MNLSIVIPCANEPRLQRTVDRIARTCLGRYPEIVVVFDGSPPAPVQYLGPLQLKTTGTLRRGTSFSRHLGVLHSSNENIFTVDAHMDFLDGDDWARRLVSELDRTPKSVLCCQMVGLTNDQPSITGEMHRYAGARIHLKTRNEKCSENLALNPKWAKNPLGPISCAMGACYAFKKPWYLEGIKAPWKYGRSWGCDEESLCIPTWLCGGQTRLVDVTVGHIMGRHGKQVLSWDDRGFAQIWYNRLRLLYMLPLDAGRRADLVEWVKASPAFETLGPLIEAELHSANLEGIVAHLASQRRTMEDFIKEWVVV